MIREYVISETREEVNFRWSRDLTPSIRVRIFGTKYYHISLTRIVKL